MTAFEDGMRKQFGELWWSFSAFTPEQAEKIWLAACEYQREVDARIAENHKYVSYGNEYGHTKIAKAIREQR